MKMITNFVLLSLVSIIGILEGSIGPLSVYTCIEYLNGAWRYADGPNENITVDPAIINAGSSIGLFVDDTQKSSILVMDDNVDFMFTKTNRRIWLSFYMCEQAPETCPNTNWQLVGSIFCYQFRIKDELVSHKHAKQSCNMGGAWLISIETVEEFDIVRQALLNLKSNYLKSTNEAPPHPVIKVNSEVTVGEFSTWVCMKYTTSWRYDCGNQENNEIQEKWPDDVQAIPDETLQPVSIVLDSGTNYMYVVLPRDAKLRIIICKSEESICPNNYTRLIEMKNIPCYLIQQMDTPQSYAEAVVMCASNTTFLLTIESNQEWKAIKKALRDLQIQRMAGIQSTTPEKTTTSSKILQHMTIGTSVTTKQNMETDANTSMIYGTQKKMEEIRTLPIHKSTSIILDTITAPMYTASKASPATLQLLDVTIKDHAESTVGYSKQPITYDSLLTITNQQLRDKTSYKTMGKFESSASINIDSIFETSSEQPSIGTEILKSTLASTNLTGTYIPTELVTETHNKNLLTKLSSSLTEFTTLQYIFKRNKAQVRKLQKPTHRLHRNPVSHTRDPDKSPLAIAVGSVSVIIITAFVVVIFVFDIPGYIRDLGKMKINIESYCKWQKYKFRVRQLP